MERLFNNQIQPQAQPISSFVQPQQFKRANAAQPSQLSSVSTIVQAQQSARGSVQGFNEFEQLAESLAPFSKILSKGVNAGFKLYATSNIEAGYYDELKNQTERSKLQLQLNQEKGAEEAAALQTQLEKMDPVGASLLREANPWKAIGRRRAMAQLAAGQVSAVMNADLANNASELSGLAPGSEELMARKQALTQQVYNQFGLTGNELEAGFYVTPIVNRSWDKYTQTQSKLYSEEVYSSSISATVAAVNSTLERDERDGIVLATGEKVFPGDPRWADQAGLNLTMEIDKGLSLLAGKDRRNAMAEINKNLGLIRAEEVPGVADAINNIRLGRAGDKDRPLWIDANPFELRDYTNLGLKLGNSEYREQQESIDARLNTLWNEMVGDKVFGSPEHQQAIKDFEAAARGLGKGDVEGWIQDRISEDREIAVAGGGVNPLTTEERFAFDETLNNLTPSDFSSEESTNAIYALARSIARREATPERAWKVYQGYVARIRAKQKEFSSLPANSRFDATIGDQLAIDLRDPKIASLKGTTRWNPLTGLEMPGSPTENESKYAGFEANIRQLMTNEAFKLIREWQNKNPGLAIPPEEVRQRIVDAANNVRKSEAYKKAYEFAVGGERGTPATESNNENAGPNKTVEEGPVPRGAEPTITPAQAKQYRSKSLMNTNWIYNDLKQLSENNTRPISPELQELSNKAGVHPYRMLIEQLKFYPSFDPDGEISRWLEESLKQLKRGNTGAVPYGNSRDIAKTERAPGAWLTAMTLPVQLNA